MQNCTEEGKRQKVSPLRRECVLKLVFGKNVDAPADMSAIRSYV
jgi:hypothetical protein